MILTLWIIVFILSLTLLIFSSDWFVDAAEKIGIFFKWPSFIVGVIIVGIGTSLPELASSIASVIQGSSEIVVGNVLGSNIANIFLVLGVAAIAGKYFELKYDILKVDIPFLITSALIISLMLRDLNFSIIEAVICLIFLFIYVYISLKSNAIDEIIEDFEEGKNHDVKFLTWIMLVISPLLISIGANYAIKAVINISEILKVGNEVIALSAVALGTSLPEVMVTIQASKKGNMEMAVGNVIGSNIFNTFAVMGISAFIGKLTIPVDIMSLTVPVFLGATLMFIIITSDKKIFRFEGVLLIGFYIYFIGNLFGLI